MIRSFVDWKDTTVAKIQQQPTEHAGAKVLGLNALEGIANASLIVGTIGLVSALVQIVKK